MHGWMDVCRYVRIYKCVTGVGRASTRSWRRWVLGAERSGAARWNATGVRERARWAARGTRRGACAAWSMRGDACVGCRQECEHARAWPWRASRPRETGVGSRASGIGRARTRRLADAGAASSCHWTRRGTAWLSSVRSTGHSARPNVGSRPVQAAAQGRGPLFPLGRRAAPGGKYEGARGARGQVHRLRRADAQGPGTVCRRRGRARRPRDAMPEQGKAARGGGGGR